MRESRPSSIGELKSYPLTDTFNVTFSNYLALDKRPKVGTESEVKQAAGENWKVVFYPGGNKRQGRAGFYLKWLAPDPDTSCDATFEIRLIGKQREGPKFDLAFASGMRFVHPSRKALTDGRASDFGSHLLEIPLLSSFRGGGPFDDSVDLSVRVTVFDREAGLEPLESGLLAAAGRANGLFWGTPRDLRAGEDGDMHVGQVVVPVIAPGAPWAGDDTAAGPRRPFGPERRAMFRLGVYPGVEFRIMRTFAPAEEARGDAKQGGGGGESSLEVCDVEYRLSGAQAGTAQAGTAQAPITGAQAKEIGDISSPPVGPEEFRVRAGSVLEVRPIYPLVRQLERTWPVRVAEDAVPAFFSQASYNAVAVAGALATALLGLSAAFAVSQAVSLYYIPSRSMEPTLQVGDLLVVEKVRRSRKGKGTCRRERGE